jgi:hypothetical protein
MIEIIEGAPEGVLAFKAVGEVRAEDYTDVLKPALDKVLAAGGKVRCVYVMGPEFTGYSAGAAWEDAEVGFAHFTSWERCAVVTDTDWVRHLVKGFAWLMPGRLRVFPVEEQQAAMEWAAAG